MRLLLPTTALLIRTALAVFADEAYQIDYHHALLGIPREDSTFVHQPNPSSKASLIYTLTDKSLIGAVNPKDGSVVWRQQLPSALNSSAAILRAGGEDVIATGTDTQIAAWTASNGRLSWSWEFEEQGQVKDIKFLELGEDGSVTGIKDVLVLFHGSQLRVERRDGATGKIRWTYVDSGADVPHQLALRGTTVYLTTLHGVLLGRQKIRVLEIDAVTGQKTEQHTLSDSDIASPKDILLSNSGSALPMLAWTDKSFRSIRVNILGTKAVIHLPIDQKDEVLEAIKIHVPGGINSLPHFLVHYASSASHWAEVYHIDLSNGSIAKAYDIPKFAGRGSFSASTSDANVYFTRIAKGAITLTSSVSHGIIERYILKTFVPGVFGDPDPLHSVSEVIVRSGGARPAVRIAVLLSSGDWALMLNGELAWSRPESLTHAETVVFAELAQGERLARELAIEEHASLLGGYVHRWKRHIAELKGLPGWLRQQPARILQSISGQEAVGGLTQKADKFGFHKFAVVATTNGRIIAVDIASGGLIAWNQLVPDYISSETWKVPTLHASAPGIVRVKTDTGHWVYGTDGHLLRKGTDGSSKASIDTVVRYEVMNNELIGFVNAESKVSLWTLKPQTGGRILSVTSRPVDDPVSSIGIVLGDRRVLYKYLNPNLALVITAYEGSNTIVALLIDTVSGNVIHEAKHSGVDISRPIPAVLSENWLTYTFTVKSGPLSSSRGHVLVTTHLMESEFPNDRGTLGPRSNSSSLQPADVDRGTPHVVSRSYQISEEVSSLAVSQTRQGITSRLLIAVLPESDSVVGIPVQMMDPRNPVGRDPTKVEQMEGLFRYNPVLDFSPQWSLNHQRDVIGVKKIVTSPAVLESTSLVFAFGLDVFGTRVTPSFSFDVLGKSFNKLQMLATVAALFVGVVFVAPLVKRKQINMRWQL